MHKYDVTFSCGHKNIAYTGRVGAPDSVTSPYKCPACNLEPQRNRRVKPHEGIGKVTVIPMLAEKFRPIYMVFVKEISSGEWKLTHYANHPLHAFWMITCVYPGATYIDPERAINKMEV